MHIDTNYAEQTLEWTSIDFGLFLGDIELISALTASHFQTSLLHQQLYFQVQFRDYPSKTYPKKKLKHLHNRIRCFSLQILKLLLKFLYN